MRQREDRAWGVGAPASCHTQRRTGMGEDGEQKPEGGWVGPDAAGHSSDPDLTQSDGQSKRGESRDTAKLNTQPRILVQRDPQHAQPSAMGRGLEVC